MSNKIDVLNKAINKIENQENQIIFGCQDSKGQPVASVENIYRNAKKLQDLGYYVGILHEQDDYTKPGSWLGSEYDELPHYSIQKNELQVDASDLLIIPEVFGNIITETTKLPCKRVVLVQNYEFIFDTIAPGYTYSDYNVTDVITINDEQKSFIEDYMNDVNVHVVPKFIPDYFEPTDKPKKPVVAVQSRDKRTTAKVIKQFYAKYKPYKFVSFSDLHNMDRYTMANELKQCCVSLWIDEYSGFGTFPLESLNCNIPVIGKAPNLVQNWMDDNNGIWVYDTNQIADILASYMQNWFEDNLDNVLYNVSDSVNGLYKEQDTNDKLQEVYSNLINTRLNYLYEVLENNKENNEEKTE